MKSLLSGIIGLSIVLVSIGQVSAGTVNCKFVLKNLSVGRTVAEIAKNMVISEEDVRKCQEEDAAKKATGGDTAESKTVGGETEK